MSFQLPHVARLLALAVATLLVVGCGSHRSGTVYMLFDASKSSAEFVRQGYRENAILFAQAYCHRYRGDDVYLNVITATPEDDSVFQTLRCPKGKNETDQKAHEIVFRAQLGARIDEVIRVQAREPGSDVIDAIDFGVRNTFDRFPTDDRYLVVFSDMQQSGGGVRNCIRGAETAADGRGCLRAYYDAHRDVRRAGALAGVDAYVIGLGKTLVGTIDQRELANYKSMWRAYFNEQRAGMCWFQAGTLPIITTPTGEKEIVDKYFARGCPPA
jgi:hypothetical protein